MGEAAITGLAGGEICATCGHFKMKEYPEHARVGVGRCAGGAARVDQVKPFLPWSRAACDRYRAAPNMAERAAWVEKRRAAQQNNDAAQPKTKG